MASDLEKLQDKISYRFSDLELARRALTHRSANKINNERLEFLGDAVLDLITAEFLLQTYPDAPEGELSRIRSAIVNKDALASVARDLALGTAVSLGAGERKSGGQERDSILADALEALIAALYLDGGIEASRQFILQFITSNYAEAADVNQKDFKTQLQEYMQAQRQPLPNYEVIEISGAPHEQLFRVRCEVAALDDLQVGCGRSKRIAEQEAAAKTLALLGVGA